MMHTSIWPCLQQKQHVILVFVTGSLLEALVLTPHTTDKHRQACLPAAILASSNSCTSLTQSLLVRDCTARNLGTDPTSKNASILASSNRRNSCNPFNETLLSSFLATDWRDCTDSDKPLQPLTS